jgi:two-component system, LuxR family, sensor kinase FixL
MKVKGTGRLGSLLSRSSLVVQHTSMAQITTALAGGMVTVTAAYVLLEWVSFIHEYNGVPVTPWNPGLGLVFGFMVLSGMRYSAVLFAGALIAEIAVLRSNLWWPIIFSISAIIAMGYGLIANVVRGYLQLDARLNRLRDVILLLASGVVGATLVATFICLLLLMDEKLDLADIRVAAGPLLIGDIIGIAVITPLTLRASLHPQSLLNNVSLRILSELLIFVVLAIAVLWIIVVIAEPHGSKLFYVIFLPIVVAAVRYGLDGACISLGITQFVLVGLLHQYGYNASAFAEFQLLMLVLSATGLTVGVVVTERQHAYDAVREIERQLRVKEAEALQVARFNIVSGTAAALAHDINQPMTAARALARAVQQLLRGPAPDPARVDSNIATLITQIDHAASVVRRMRDFLRRGRPHSSTINVRDLLADALALAGSEKTPKRVSLTLDVPDDLPVVHGDAVQLQQVVLNLLHNAMEAIEDARMRDGRITVAARRLKAPDRIEISVMDNGPGIATEMTERLFHPLVTSKTDGLGLGLSICASILQVHGGRVWLHAGNAGATEFRFSLPLEMC